MQDRFMAVDEIPSFGGGILALLDIKSLRMEFIPDLLLAFAERTHYGPKKPFDVIDSKSFTYFLLSRCTKVQKNFGWKSSHALHSLVLRGCIMVHESLWVEFVPHLLLASAQSKQFHSKSYQMSLSCLC